MQTHLIAPSELIPSISARLNFSPPSGQYSIHPLESQTDTPSPGSNLLLIQAPNAAYACELKQRSHNLVDAFIIPAPLAPYYGFITLVSGDIASLNLHAPILNSLSPISNGWLHCGNIGAASFMHQLWQALLTPQGTNVFLAWDGVAPTSTGNTNFTLTQPDILDQLAKFLAQQQLQTQTLASLARRYLLEHPPSQFIAHHPQTTQLFPFLPQNEASPVHQLASLLAQY
ncbi:hypothetical protein HQ393_04195 [Chitinibacter bivalviorum]|uniref:Uncharacterized protein n=1 Tax=Chitinibacter bivalviorum TaxID=2739434 RepID=A0A7H9BG06_9NEIS|nr:hypothetical protein [Chitinibacter bivalviorum]QLG87515.1 hypothetical protein HQ393_04195 [Chitinibacter bivalviorum]